MCRQDPHTTHFTPPHHLLASLSSRPLLSTLTCNQCISQPAHFVCLSVCLSVNDTLTTHGLCECILCMCERLAVPCHPMRVRIYVAVLPYYFLSVRFCTHITSTCLSVRLSVRLSVCVPWVFMASVPSVDGCISYAASMKCAQDGQTVLHVADLAEGVTGVGWCLSRPYRQMHTYTSRRAGHSCLSPRLIRHFGRVRATHRRRRTVLVGLCCVVLYVCG